MRMVYWLCGRTSITMPVRSHFPGAGPAWFWTKQLSPTTNFLRSLACWFSFSDVLTNLVRRACSFSCQASRHTGCIAMFEYFSSLFTYENASFNGLPKIICAGDNLQSGSGVFLSCNMALRNLSLFSFPELSMFDFSNLLVDLTATSARPLDW